MSQRDGSIYVCVKGPSDWKKLYDMEIDDEWWLNATTGRDLFSGIEGTEWYIDGDWSPEFGNGFVWLSGLGRFVWRIAELLGRENCVILACLTDINVDPFEYIYFSLGSYCEQKDVRGICGGPRIQNIIEWMRWARIKLTPDRLKHLYQFDATRKSVQRIMPVKALPRNPKSFRRGRMFVAVNDPTLWAKTKRLGLTDPAFALPNGFAAQLSENKSNVYELSDAWEIEYGTGLFAGECPLYQVVSKIRKLLGKNNCIIVADCADSDVSPVYKIVYALEGSVTCKEVNTDLSAVSIHDVEGWLQAAGIKIDSKKRVYLEGFPVCSQSDSGSGGCLEKEGASTNDLAGLVFAVTGDVSSFKSRAELKKYIEARGGKLASSVTAKTHYLITNTPDSGTSKNRAAQELGISIITEAEFLKQFGQKKTRAPSAPAVPEKNDSILRIPEGTKQIKKGEFKDRTGIVKVIIPDSVTVIGESAFTKCVDLEEVVFPAGLKEIKKGAFYRCAKLKRAILPDGIEIIGENAFNACKVLEEVHLGSALKELGPKAFRDCPVLVEIHIPDGVKKLCYQLFQGCKSLKTVTYGSNIAAIGDACFLDCASVTSLSLPDTIRKIYNEAFKGCTSLSMLEAGELSVLQDVGFNIIDGTALKSKLIEDKDCLYLGGILVFATGDQIVIRDHTTAIVMHALQNIRSLTLPASLDRINLNFWSADSWGDGRPVPLSDSLEEVVLLPGFRAVDSRAFFNLKKLRSVVIPESVREIDDEAFQYIDGSNGDYQYHDIPDLTIRGQRGTEAERFAISKGYAFREI